jgi:hypothetical protein
VFCGTKKRDVRVVVELNGLLSVPPDDNGESRTQAERYGRFQILWPRLRRTQRRIPPVERPNPLDHLAFADEPLAGVRAVRPRVHLATAGEAVIERIGVGRVAFARPQTLLRAPAEVGIVIPGCVF